MTQNYSERVQKLFERVGHLQTAVDEEKSNRIREVETVVAELERKMREMREIKEKRENGFGDVVPSLA